MRARTGNTSALGLEGRYNWWIVAAGLLLALGCGNLQAEIEFDWNGFGTLGAGILDDDSINEVNSTPHNGYDEDWQADVDSRLGFQGSARFNPSTSATLQLIADSASNDDVEVEWAYLSYDFDDQFKLRAGRLRKPLYVNSDFLRVGYAYAWARPPIEVYSRDIQIYDGVDAVDLLWQSSVGSWDLLTEVYFGGFEGETESSDGQELDYETRDDVGIVFEIEKDGLSFRFGYHYSPDVSVETSDELQTLFDGLSAAGFGDLAEDLEIDGITGEFYNLGVGYDVNEWLFAAEYVYLPVDGGLAPDEETSWYLTAGRRYGDWTFHLTYGDRRRKVDEDFAEPIYDQAAIIGPPFNAGLLALADGVDQAEQALEMDIHSYTLGARYDFDDPISLKIEYQYIVDDQFDLTNNLFSVVVDFLF